MTWKICELISILLTALVAGVFWGPWVALTRSMASFDRHTFLTIVQRLNANLGPLMTGLMPVTIASTLPILFHLWRIRSAGFYLTGAALGLLLLSLLVTVRIEVPIVHRIASSTPGTLPHDWQQLRDRWGAFHLVRILAGVSALALLVAAAIV